MKQSLVAILGFAILLIVGGLTGCGEDSTVAAANGPPARPLQTGQTTCYDATGNTTNTIPCAGTGQDGATQTGVTRKYIDNGDGTITDASTGLMWEKKDQSGGIHDWNTRYVWGDAFSVFIAGLNSTGFAGHTDWRLPNRFELETLIDLGQNDPAINPMFHASCTPGCTVTTCSCTQSNLYWSATTDAGFPGTAWLVGLDGGGVTTASKAFNTYVHAVRSGL